MKKITNIKQYNVDNNVIILNFVCFWKTPVEDPSTNTKKLGN